MSIWTAWPRCADACAPWAYLSSQTATGRGGSCTLFHLFRQKNESSNLKRSSFDVILIGFHSLCGVNLRPLWVFRWEIKVDLTVKDFPHLSHLNGFSPVCILRWRTRSLGFLKLLGQWLHWLACLGMLASLAFFEKSNSHILNSWWRQVSTKTLGIIFLQNLMNTSESANCEVLKITVYLKIQHPSRGTAQN